MSERKKVRSPRRRIGIRRNSSKRLAGTATGKGPRYASATFPVKVGPSLVGYFAIASQGYEALTPEKASLGLFTGPMPAVHALFEQFFPEAKST
jgi:hypothetical protein